MIRLIRKKLFKYTILGISIMVLCTYSAFCAPQKKMSASISGPKLRGEYKNDNNIKLKVKSI
jgi:hypothetical protein